MKKIEQAILEWATQQHPEMAHQIEMLEVDSRENSGAGLYVHFKPLPLSVPALGIKSPCSGPQIESSQLEHGAGSLIWLKDGRISFIEIFAYGNQFPEELDEFEIK